MAGTAQVALVVRPTLSKGHDVVYLRGPSQTTWDIAVGMVEQEGCTDPAPRIPIATAGAGGTELILTLASLAGVGGAVPCAYDRGTTWMRTGGGEDGHRSALALSAACCSSARLPTNTARRQTHGIRYSRRAESGGQRAHTQLGLIQTAMKISGMAYSLTNTRRFRPPPIPRICVPDAGRPG